MENLCIICGKIKEDYESTYCDNCWEKEQKRIEENNNKTEKGENKMEKYCEMLEKINEEKLDITKLYILSCLPINPDRFEMLEAIYDTWLDIDEDICLARLCDIIVEHWEEYKNDEYDTDDIISDLF